MKKETKSNVKTKTTHNHGCEEQHTNDKCWKSASQWKRSHSPSTYWHRAFSRKQKRIFVFRLRVRRSRFSSFFSWIFYKTKAGAGARAGELKQNDKNWSFLLRSIRKVWLSHIAFCYSFIQTSCHPIAQAFSIQHQNESFRLKLWINFHKNSFAIKCTFLFEFQLTAFGIHQSRSSHTMNIFEYTKNPELY